MRNKKTMGDIAFDVIIYMVLFFVFIVTVYPFWYILMYSFSQPGKIGTRLLLYPKGFNIDAYLMMLKVGTIPHAFMISALRTALVPLLAVLITSMAAYALKDRRLPGRGFFVKFLMVTMYFSSGMIPTYLLISNLRLPGTFWVYVIPHLFGVYNMVLIKTYMESLPEALGESAMIDGASDFVIFIKITLPLCKPVLAAVILFLCIGQWNNYTDTMLYNPTKKEYHTLSYVLMNFIQTNTSSVEDARRRAAVNTINSTSLKMAMTVTTTIPIMMIYPMLQKSFAKGILIGSIKG